ncbi:response regulator [Pelagibius sp.]|uniref:response regulator n=1 Tax=Pelagibius sp. TaxID=1931238 RepID=UPI003BB0FB4F
MAAKVLVVEDDELTRFLMGEMCRALGLDCEIVADGQNCLDRLQAGPVDFDLVLMDLHMPRVSGLEATKAIRNSADYFVKALPVVAVTADTHWHERSQYEPHGFDSVLPKPVEMDALTAIVALYTGQNIGIESPSRTV